MQSVTYGMERGAFAAPNALLSILQKESDFVAILSYWLYSFLELGWLLLNKVFVSKSVFLQSLCKGLRTL